MIEIKAPNKIPQKGYKLFLAGSIEMGKAENWQENVVKMLLGHNIVILNPRRDDWDSSWEQSKNNPKFREQVMWELRGLNIADEIWMYFDPETKSPITLLELGLYAFPKLAVICPDGYWRKGNVDIVCESFNIPMYDNFDDLYTDSRISDKYLRGNRPQHFVKFHS